MMAADDLREVVRAILAELPMSDDGTGHVADCGYSEDGPACGCASLPGRIRAFLLDTRPAPSDDDETITGYSTYDGRVEFATPSEPEATVVEEWAVRHAQGVYAGDCGRPLTEQRARAWAEENRARDGRRRREAQGKTMLLRRIVTEWEEVDG